MSAGAPPLRMLGAAGAAERPVLIAAGELLARCVSEATGSECRIALSFAPPCVMPTEAPDLVVASPLGEVASPDPIAAIAARWHAWLGDLVRPGAPHVVIATLYRHVADPARRPALAERIRRLNELVLALSRRHGVEVADVDRAFSLVGSAIVGGDYRAVGPDAARIAGHVLASALLAADLAPHLPATRVGEARVALGTLDALVRRRHERAA